MLASSRRACIGRIRLFSEEAASSAEDDVSASKNGGPTSLSLAHLTEIKGNFKLIKSTESKATATPVSKLRSLAANFRREYSRLPPQDTKQSAQVGRKAVLVFLARDLLPTAASSKQALASTAELHVTKTIEEVTKACTPGYMRLFQSIIEEDAKEGIKFLLELRTDLINYLRPVHREETKDFVAELKLMNKNLRSLLMMWFSPSILDIQRITFDSTSAGTIEKIAVKEAVHPIRDLDDLRGRLGADRRVFAAFHPFMSDEPLVFVHAAMRPFIATEMEHVLTPATETDPNDAKAAIFYSISSTQPGLSGIDLGQSLLRTATNRLQQEFPALETFVTLSPIPRFRKWLQHEVNELVTAGVGDLIELFCDEENFQQLGEALDTSADASLIKFLDMLGDPQYLMENHGTQLEPVLLKLAAFYLVKQKRRGKPLDDVARFHIRNGAEMLQLNYGADLSRKGIHNSFGIMVNYHYSMETLQENKDRFESEFHVPIGDGVSKYLRERPDILPSDDTDDFDDDDDDLPAK